MAAGAERPVPRVVVPSLNVTVPVGVPAPGRDGGHRRREGHRLAEHRRVGRRGQAWSPCSPC